MRLSKSKDLLINSSNSWTYLSKQFKRNSCKWKLKKMLTTASTTGILGIKSKISYLAAEKSFLRFTNMMKHLRVSKLSNIKTTTTRKASSLKHLPVQSQKSLRPKVNMTLKLTTC
jgi:hypothetical protein